MIKLNNETNLKINKKGQISIFIIIGAIIILGSVLFFSYNSDSIHIFSSEKSSYKIKQFVEDCMEEETKTAVNELGLHGGWLYNPYSNMNFAKVDENKFLVKNAKGFDYFGVQIPYWYYYDDSDETFRINIPEYDTEDTYSLKNQIKTYLDENLEKNCIKSFSSFENIYIVKYEPREINTKVIFDEDIIEVSLDLPLEIIEVNANNSEFIDTFTIREENKLKVPYYLAKDIVNAESQNSFVEFRMLNFISAYQSTTDKSLLPPFYDFRMVFDKQPWKVKDVEALTKQVISSEIGVIQFSETDTNVREIPKELESSEFARSFYENYNKDYFENYSLVREENPSIYRQFKEYEVTPTFDVFYPMYFSLSPSYGDVVLFPKSEAILGILPFFFTEYTSVYEITTPILFEIKPNFENDDFVFNLVIETNIDHNKPLRENYDIEFDPSEFGSNDNKNLICEPSQFISKPIYLNITDPVDFGNRHKLQDPKIGVSDAIVTFTCKSMATCYMGQTAINGEFISRNITQIALQLPINCNPGTLEIYKFGHKKITIENLDPNLEESINLGELKMYSKKKLELKTKLIDPVNERRSSTGSSLDKDTSAFLILENLEDKDVVEVVEITSENQDNLSVELMPGNYSITGFVIYNGNIYIPSEESCQEGGFFSDDICITLPEISMDSWVRGGIDYQGFEIKDDKLLQSDIITIALVDFGIPTSYAELNAMSSYMTDLKGVSFKPCLDEYSTGERC